MASTAAIARIATPGRILTALMVVLLALALVPAEAQAAPTKVGKNCNYQTQTSVIKKKATVVKKAP